MYTCLCIYTRNSIPWAEQHIHISLYMSIYTHSLYRSACKDLPVCIPISANALVSSEEMCFLKIVGLQKCILFSVATRQPWNWKVVKWPSYFLFRVVFITLVCIIFSDAVNTFIKLNTTAHCNKTEKSKRPQNTQNTPGTGNLAALKLRLCVSKMKTQLNQKNSFDIKIHNYRNLLWILQHTATRQKKQKVPKYPKYSRNEKFSSTGIEDVCFKDETPDIKIHNYRNLFNF